MSTELKWAENAAALERQGCNVLNSLQAVKQFIDTESLISNMEFTFYGEPLSPDSPTPPNSAKISILNDPSIQALAKTINKKFPDVNVPKVTPFKF